MPSEKKKKGDRPLYQSSSSRRVERGERNRSNGCAAGKRGKGRKRTLFSLFYSILLYNRGKGRATEKTSAIFKTNLPGREVKRKKSDLCFPPYVAIKGKGEKKKRGDRRIALVSKKRRGKKRDYLRCEVLKSSREKGEGRRGGRGRPTLRRTKKTNGGGAKPGQKKPKK